MLPLDPAGRVIQPGPAQYPRAIGTACKTRRLEIELPAGMSLLDSATEALRRAGEAGIGGAFLHLAGGGFGPFHYVIPSLAVSPEHAAYYSATFSPAGESALESGRLTFGRRDGKPWLHCHALWREANGKLSGGHILPEQAMIARPIAAVAWVLDGAAYETRHDAETNFHLLGPVRDAPHGRGGSDAAAWRIKANADLAEMLQFLVTGLEWDAARIVGGVGSLAGVRFADGRVLSPRPTELFISRGAATPDEVAIDVAGVDHLGERFEGRLAEGNTVLMTMELGLVRIS
jgi:hypothetical protein